MALGFFIGTKDGVGRFLGPDDKVFEVPEKNIPKGLKPGQDFNYRASSKGHVHITPPAEPSKNKATNSAKDRQQYTVKRLMSHGWTASQASGVVGRWMEEAYSDLRTNAYNPNDPEGSYGLGQWNRERRAALRAFATGEPPKGKYQNHPLVLAAAKASSGGMDPSDLNAQIDFFNWEIRNSPTEKNALVTLSAAKTPMQAVLGMMHYERPDGYKVGNPAGGLSFKPTVGNAQRVMAGYDPNYTPDVVTSGAPSDGELGAGFDPNDPGAQGGELDQDIPAPDSGEEDLGTAISDASAGYAESGGGTVDTRDSMQNILNMIEQGRQSTQSGSLPGFPTFGELFGQG